MHFGRMVSVKDMGREGGRGVVKDLLAKGLETEVVFIPDDLEDLLAEIVSLKNRRGNRGGFTPYQLVIGQNPRVPHELLSDDAVDEVGMQELSRDDADIDSPAKAFRQSMRIRDHARMLVETHMARERLRSAGKAQLYRDGCMCGEEICVEQEIELAVHRFLGGSVQDLLLYKMAPRFGCQ